jgi:phosphatidylinositol dimannoside acyltransferase
VTPLYRTCAALFRTVPRPISEGITETVYEVVARLSAERRLIVTRHLRRLHTRELSDRELDRAITETFRSYGRYWVESFRLPRLSSAELDHWCTYEGLEHVLRPVTAGRGTIVAMPHLGGWEWAAFWTARILELDVTAVVEPVDPPELFEFFTEFRRSLGLHIVPLGPEAGREVLRALRSGHVLALLADRDIERNGVEVEFFGERTTLPAGPATLALRTGSPLVPAAAYLRGRQHHIVARPPVPSERRERRLRDDVVRVTQALAHELEALIRVAPEQWHVQQPNWPSDWAALEAVGHPHPRAGEPVSAPMG